MPEERFDIKESLSSLALLCDDAVVSKVTLYLSELERWNKRYGFIKADHADLFRLHFMDALAGLPLFRSVTPPGPVLDFGSGAGFPGMPLALFQAERPFVLCERKATERAFLENIAALLNLTHVSVIDSISKQEENSLAVVTFRAVTSLKDMHTAVHRFVMKGGLLFAYKGTYEKIREETEALKQEGLRSEIHPVTVPGVDRERHIVLVHY